MIMMTAPRSFDTLALIPELLTSVRVEAAVQRMGGSIRVEDTESGFLVSLDRTVPAIAILDLQTGGLNLAEIAGACSKRGVPLVAFGRHVDAGALRTARHAGIEIVVPRGKFLEDTQGIVGSILARAAVSRAGP